MSTDLKFKHPELWVLQGRDKPRVVAAKNIRKELSRFYPDTKFTVRSDNFANGNAVRIVWTGGPDQSEIARLVDKYQNRFGDTDWNKTFGGAVFVTTHRHRDEVTA